MPIWQASTSAQSSVGSNGLGFLGPADPDVVITDIHARNSWNFWRKTENDFAVLPNIARGDPARRPRHVPLALAKHKQCETLQPVKVLNARQPRAACLMTRKFRTNPRWSGTERGNTVKNATLQVPTLPTEGKAAVGSTPRTVARQGVRRHRRIEHQVHLNPHVVDPDTLRELSGKRSRSGVRKWATKQGIRVLDGENGLWTTAEALNDALGVRAGGDLVYSPEDIA